jgi:biopolymer transport protein ExbD
MQERRAVFRQGIAELIERDVLPLLNLMLLLLPIVLLGIELVSRSAIAVTLPDTSPDVASLDTPRPPRPSVSLSKDHSEARSPSEPQIEGPMVPQASLSPSASATAASVFSDSPLGYGN